MKPTRIIKSHAVTTMGKEEPGSNHTLRKPQVRLMRNGDHVEALEITCSCGEIILLDCLYDTKSEVTS